MPDEQITTMPALTPLGEEPEKIQGRNNMRAKVPARPLPQALEKSGWGTGAVILFIIIALIIGALAGAAGIYFWQTSQTEQEISRVTADKNQQISDLQAQLDTAKADLTAAENQLAIEKQKPAIPDIKITPNNEMTEYTINDGATEITKLTFDQPSDVLILKQTAENIYIKTAALLETSATIYSNSATGNQLYKYNLKTKNWGKIFGDESTGVIYDISDDENLILSINNDQISLYNLTDQSTLNFNASNEFNEFGDLLLSPNAKKIAYAAVMTADNQQIENSAILMIDILNNATTKIIEGENRIYHTKNWLGNEDSDLQYYYYPTK